MNNAEARLLAGLSHLSSAIISLQQYRNTELEPRSKTMEILVEILVDLYQEKEQALKPAPLDLQARLDRAWSWASQNSPEKAAETPQAPLPS